MSDTLKGDVGPVRERETSRRKVIKGGAALIPTIFTLTAVPAWAESDYTRVAYRYGAQAGLCKNPDYRPNASPNSPRSREFVECPSGSDPRGGRE